MTCLLKIYGERNTGTNYMSRLIAANLTVQEIPGVVPRFVRPLIKVTHPGELVRDLYFDLTFHRNLGWKHSKVRAASDIEKYRLTRRGVRFLTITKNPYSWLLSLYRRPYHQRNEGQPDFETFLRSPWRTVGRDGCEAKLDNPIELWNIKNASYLNLSVFRWLPLTTEEILKDPERAIDKVCSTLDIPRRSSQFINIEKSTKDGSKNYSFYRKYYMDEEWRNELSEHAISIINRAVDADVMSRFGYSMICSDGH
jgi:hypothetical protein